VKEGGDVTINNCDILLEHPDGSACVWEGDNDETGVARVRDSQVDAHGDGVQRFHGNVDIGSNVGQNPDVSVPAGVPQSATQAAKGSGGDHTLQIEGSGSRTTYSFTVNNNLKGAGNLNPEDEISNQSASGAVSGGTDTYTFDGELVAFDFDGAPINVYLDGEPARVGQRPDHYLRIERSGETTTYDFTVDSNLQKSGVRASINSNDDINNQSASGAVGGGSDAYTFDGDLRAFDFDGAPINVYLDGEPARVGQRPDHYLRIERSGETTTYDFTVDSNLQKSGVRASINSNDDINNQSASGAVGGGSDAYTFDGDLRAFDFDGAPINVYLDGEPARVGQRPDHYLRIEGSGENTDYIFTASNNLQKSGVRASTNSGDDINHQSASGAVGGGADAYTFDGELVAFDFDGAPINVYLDGESARVGQR